LAVFANNRINIELYHRFTNKPKPAGFVIRVKQPDSTMNTSDKDIAGNWDCVGVIFS
jgi:hypothetical protein